MMFSLRLPLLVFIAGLFPAQAQENLCKAEVKPAANSSLSYRLRGDRCEGLFAQKVSATGIRIAAFHNHPATFDQNALALNIGSGSADASKELVVTSLKDNQYYRMDTRYADSNFTLSLDLIRHPDIAIAPAELAAVICSSDCDTSVPTLLPVSFAEEGLRNPYVALIANLELYELRIVIRDEETNSILHDKEMLGSRTWPAGRPATFPLKPYLENHESVLFEVVAKGRGNMIIDSISARLQAK